MLAFTIIMDSYKTKQPYDHRNDGHHAGRHWFNYRCAIYHHDNQTS